MGICEETTYESPYLEYAISLSLVIFLQFLLLINSIYHEYSKHNKKIALISRILFIILQLTGLSWTIMDFLRLVIDPYTSIIRNNIGCGITSWVSKTFTTIYYAIYLHQILLRLELSFQNSFYRLNKITVYILTLLIYLVMFSSMILMLALNNNPPCKVAWDPPDFPNHNLECCSIILSSNVEPIVIFGFVFVVLFNILLGSIFTIKLKKLLSYTDDENKGFKFKFKWLIVKNCLLTLAGATSTLITYSLWVIKLFGIGPMFLYFDMLINALAIALMIKYNEKYYKFLCKYCIVLCLRDCDKTKNKKNEEQIMKYLHRALSAGESQTLNIQNINIENDNSGDEVIKKVETMSVTPITITNDKMNKLRNEKEDIDLYSGTEMEIIEKSNTNTVTLATTEKTIEESNQSNSAMLSKKHKQGLQQLGKLALNFDPFEAAFQQRDLRQKTMLQNEPQDDEQAITPQATGSYNEDDKSDDDNEDLVIQKTITEFIH
eukprot:153472_1